MGKFSRLGNDLYNGKRSIDFVGRKWLWYAISGVILLLAVLSLSVKGLDMGIEFVGGAEYKVGSVPAESMNQSSVDDLRAAVADTGIDAAQQPVVTTNGDSGLLVQVKPVTTTESARIKATILDTTGASATNLQIQEIGPSWGKEIAKRSAMGLVVFLVLVVLFIWAYFREWKMSIAALVALGHDVLITIGVYALSGFEVSPATVTGVLTILGFSLYDTVVVFDKVRENTRNLRQSKKTYAQLANLAVNQTLVRSINTSIVALLPVGVILYVGVATLGTGALKDLSLSLFVGMAAGAYSSIFIATPLVVHLKSREKAITEQDARAKARARRTVDRYADVPVFADDMPVRDRAGVDPEELEEEQTQRAVKAPPRRPEASGSGRVVPGTKAPLGESGAAKRAQPKRQPRSKRGK